MSRVVILGASTGPGRLLFERLRDSNVRVLGLARSKRDIVESENAVFSCMDAGDPALLQATVEPTDTLIHCSRPEFLTNYLKTEPELKRLIAIGSARIYTRFPDDKCHRVAAMAHVIRKADIPSTLLHPTLIYGAPGLNNINRVVKIARLSPVIPLPDKGRALIQPVHAEDLARAILACLNDESTVGKTIDVPGKEAVSYRRFIELCIEASGARCRVVSAPYFLVCLLAPFTHLLPGVPTVTRDEIRRLLEDKNFSTEALIRDLGVEPRALEEGLKLALAELPFAQERR